MKKIFVKLSLLIIVAFTLTGCTSNFNQISYNDLNDMIKNKKSFVLVVSQDGCSHCEEYEPRFKKILKNYDLEAYNLNITYISEKNFNKFNDKYSFEGTPTTMFFKKGEEVFSSRLTGSVTDKKVVTALKKLKFIK